MKWSESKSLSRVWLFATPWCTVHGILQARILEGVAFPFSRESSQPTDWTQVSRIADEFFTSWATREAHVCVCVCVCVYTPKKYIFYLTLKVPISKKKKKITTEK